jgi:hypothetical protein
MVFSAMRADWGARFLAAVPTEKDGNAWRWRLYQRLQGESPDAVIDGYERAVAEREPYMPELIDIVGAVGRIRRDRMRVEQQIADAAAPRFTGGIAGYVETVLAPVATTDAATQALERMRNALRRRMARPPDERANRLDAALAEHRRLMDAAPRVRHRGEYRGCGVPGCPRPGTHTHAVGASSAIWFCVDHWRGA